MNRRTDDDDDDGEWEDRQTGMVLIVLALIGIFLAGIAASGCGRPPEYHIRGVAVWCDRGAPCPTRDELIGELAIAEVWAAGQWPRIDVRRAWDRQDEVAYVAEPIPIPGSTGSVAIGMTVCSRPYQIWLAARGAALLAHELTHHWLALAGEHRDCDPDHTSPAWRSIRDIQEVAP